MCVVSMIIDYGRRTWGEPYEWRPTEPYIIPQWPQPVKSDWDRLLDLIKKAKEIDEATGQPDCEDPKKVEWLEAMEKRMKALEDKLAK